MPPEAAEYERLPRDVCQYNSSAWSVPSMYDAETNGYDGGKGKRKRRDEKVEKLSAVFGLTCWKE